MLDPAILFAALVNGLTQGAVYALVALGLTLIYGVLHIINFAHGAALMMALYGVYFLQRSLGLDPYVSLAALVPGMFAAGYLGYRFVIGRASHGKDENILLVTLGISIVLENLALTLWKSDTRTIETAYTFSTVAIGPAAVPVATRAPIPTATARRVTRVIAGAVSTTATAVPTTSIMPAIPMGRIVRIIPVILP